MSRGGHDQGTYDPGTHDPGTHDPGTYDDAYDGPVAGAWDEAGAAEVTARRRRLRVGTSLILLLALSVAGLATVTTMTYLDLRALRDGEAAGPAALAAARAYAPELMSYDYRTVSTDFARARGHTTGALTGYYRRLETTLGPVIAQRRTVQRVEVLGAAVESAAPGRVQVLILLNRATTTTLPGAKAPRREVTTGRTRLVMVKANNGWLVSDLSTLLGNVPPAL
ncbi:MAG TPA: hypothetical protein VIR33_03720 [Thermopolyspora sp.]